MRRRDALRGIGAAGLLLAAGDARAFELVDDLTAWLAGRELRLLLAFGQSNMRGNVTPQGEGLIEHPRVLAHYVGDRDSLWSVNPRPASTRYTRRWATAVEPLCWGTNAPMGPAFICAKDLADAWGEGVVVGIVPCAEGGKPLSYFDLQTFQYGLPALAARNAGATWAGIIFAQGESEASANWTQEAYAAACDAWLAQYRAALKAPDLPIVCSELTQTSNYAGKAAVNRALADWPNRDAHAAWISSVGAASASAHFTYPGYVEMGHRFATALLGM